MKTSSEKRDFNALETSFLQNMIETFVFFCTCLFCSAITNSGYWQVSVAFSGDINNSVSRFQ